MSVFTTNNMISVLIGRSIPRTASVQITDSSASGYIADGEVLALNYLDQPLTAGQTISDSPYIRLVQRSGDRLIFSPRINGVGVKSYKGQSGSAAQEQIYVLGYNGTSSSIDLTTIAKILKITYTFDENIWLNQQFKRSYVSQATTQAEVANDIATVMNADGLNALMGNGNSAGGYIKAEILSNDAAAALGAGTVSVVKGSPTITASSASHGLTVGEWIRIGSVATTTDPVYKVIAVSGVTITVSMPYQGSTATGVTAGQITTANAATMAAGVKMTGLSLSFGLMPYSNFKHMKVTFKVHPGDGWGSTALTKTQEASKGAGTYEIVAEQEHFANKFEGLQNQSVTPFAYTNKADAISGTLYDVIQIFFAEPGMDSTAIMANAPADQQIAIYLVDGAPQQGTLRGQLNPWMASTPRQLANIGAL